MATLTIRMPDDTHERLKQLASARRVSINKLMEELSTAALAGFDAEVRFRARAVRGRRDVGLALLAKLDGRAPGRPLSRLPRSTTAVGRRRRAPTHQTARTS